MNSTDGAIIDALAAANGGAGTLITDSAYNADADINRDGQINEDDGTFFAALPARAPLGGTGSGRISDPDGPDNVLGYCGYVFNREHRNYTVRYRTYFPELGRWGQRDPAGYVDGLNLHSYTTRVLLQMDPFGLMPWLVLKTLEYATEVAKNQRHIDQAEDAVRKYCASETSTPKEVVEKNAVGAIQHTTGAADLATGLAEMECVQDAVKMGDDARKTAKSVGLAAKSLAGISIPLDALEAFKASQNWDCLSETEKAYALSKWLSTGLGAAAVFATPGFGVAVAGVNLIAAGLECGIEKYNEAQCKAIDEDLCDMWTKQLSVVKGRQLELLSKPLGLSIPNQCHQDVTIYEQ